MSARTFILVLICLALAGCGTRTVVVSGQVTDNQKPLVVGKQGQILIYFTPAGSDSSDLASSHSAAVDLATGKYVLRGPEGKGIPPGKYHVTVRQYDPYPLVDKLKGVFASPSQVTCDVIDGQAVNLDVAEWRKSKARP